MINATTGLCFDDVLLVPKFSDITTRKEINTSSQLSDSYQFRLPVISSPMDTITESAMAAAMENAGGFGIVHRYNTLKAQSLIVKLARDNGCVFVGAAVGVTGDFEERACALYDAGASVLCIDIAHGHHVLMKRALFRLREIFGNSVHIMAGNVATLEGFNDLADWGADSIRVGIGGGSICSTRIQTGHGVPTFQSIDDCSYSDRDVVMVADGGIRNSGDAVKALAAGADFVMMGSLLSGTHETPGEIIINSGERYKTYRGMASKDAQIDWRGHTSSVEGVSSLIPAKGAVRHVLAEIEQGIKSGMSYSGARDLFELQAAAKFIRQTGSGGVESSTHIRSRGILTND